MERTMPLEDEDEGMSVGNYDDQSTKRYSSEDVFDGSTESDDEAYVAYFILDEEISKKSFTIQMEEEEEDLGPYEYIKEFA